MDKSKILGLASLILLLAIAAFIAFHDSPTPPPAAPAIASAPNATVPVQAQPEPLPAASLHRYNISIVTAADWTRVLLLDATFVSDSRPGFNPVEMSSDPPESINHFLYSPEEISIGQKPFAGSRIVIRGVIESAQPTIHVRIGHGDNGPVTISSPTDSATNDKVLGDGLNFTVSALRLE